MILAPCLPWISPWGARLLSDVVSAGRRDGTAGLDGPRPRSARPQSGWPRPGRLWPWAVLWPWALLSSLLHARGAGVSWHFFADGGRLLLGGGTGGGLHVYAAHPQYQIGPLALALAGGLRALSPTHSELAAILAMSATGPLVLAAVWRLLPVPQRRSAGRLLAAGLLFLPVWAELTTHFGHLDDLLALCFAVAAAHAVARGHPVWAGLALAAAADSKPWAVAFAALLLALPRRDRLPALAVFTAGMAVAWLPFLLADPHTLLAARFAIPNDPSSALRVLGVGAARTPWWDRPAQLALGLAGGWLAVRRGRWPAVILVAVCARILLDPAVYPYYTSGVLLGTIGVDLVVTRWRVPWITLLAVAMLYVTRFTGDLVPFPLAALGLLRAVFAIGVPVLVLALPARRLARTPGRHARDPSHQRGRRGRVSVVPPTGIPGGGGPGGPAPWSGRPERAACGR